MIAFGDMGRVEAHPAAFFKDVYDVHKQGD
jgi:hypothetical protein